MKNIGKDTFKGCKKLIIKGKKGSYAQKYAKKNKIKFIVV